MEEKERNRRGRLLCVLGVLCGDQTAIPWAHLPVGGGASGIGVLPTSDRLLQKSSGFPFAPLLRTLRMGFHLKNDIAFRDACATFLP